MAALQVKFSDIDQMKTNHPLISVIKSSINCLSFGTLTKILLVLFNFLLLLLLFFRICAYDQKYVDAERDSVFLLLYITRMNLK